MKKQQPEAKRSQEIELMEVNDIEEKSSLTQEKKKKFNKIIRS
jgi:hypothetical protein